MMPMLLAAVYAAPLIARSRLRPPAAFFWPLSVGLGIGLFTVLLTVVAFDGLTSTRLWVILTALWIPSTFWGNWPRMRLSPTEWWNRLRQGKCGAWVGLAVSAILLVVVAQASYYPFTGDDEISRYAYFARLILENGKLSAEMRGYPPLLSTAYVSTFLAAGGIREQAAKMYPVLMAAMTIWATYSLALRWFGKRAASAAALTLAATPLFMRWAPIGYVDIASGLYFVLCAFALEIWRERLNLGWALLSGVIGGLALWTKQAGFALLPIMGLLVLTQIIRRWTQAEPEKARRALGHGLLMLAAAFATGGWWYLRNALYDGWAGAVPDAGLYHLLTAPRRPLQLIPFVGNFLDFGWLTAPLYIMGLVWATIAQRETAVRRALLWCGPYTIVWWWRFSFDARFLLAVLPFYSVLAGSAITNWWRHVEEAAPSRTHPFLRTAIILSVAVGGMTQARLGGLFQWAAQPGASYSERLTRAKGDLYPTVQFLQIHIDPTTNIHSTDARIRYYLIDRPITVGYPSLDLLEEHDVFVVGSWASAVYKTLDPSNKHPLADLENSILMDPVYTGPSNRLVVYRSRSP
jgi:hypothetical protein